MNTIFTYRSQSPFHPFIYHQCTLLKDVENFKQGTSFAAIGYDEERKILTCFIRENGYLVQTAVMEPPEGETL